MKMCLEALNSCQYIIIIIMHDHSFFALSTLPASISGPAIKWSISVLILLLRCELNLKPLFILTYLFLFAYSLVSTLVHCSLFSNLCSAAVIFHSLASLTMLAIGWHYKENAQVLSAFIDYVDLVYSQVWYAWVIVCME